MDISALHKRIKRRVKAKKHRFYAVYPPEFQEEVLLEFKNYEADIISAEKGGLEFQSGIEECIRINLASPSLTRILLRIDEFRSILFSEFKRGISSVEWELYLNPELPLNFSISCRASRLYHTVRIETEARKGIENRLESFYGKKISTEQGVNAQTVFIRINENRVTVSLDSSGQPLYMRGIKTEISDAPLRENLAALLLLKAGLDDCNALIDPMSGTGTFSIEAYQRANGLFPGRARNYAFENWPVFSRAAFEHLKKSRENKNTGSLKIYTSDISEKNVQSINRNFQRAEMEFTAECADFFSLKKMFPDRKVLIALNPPYGKRIDSEGRISDFYIRIAEKMRKDFNGTGYIILCPYYIDLNSLRLEYDEVFSFNHGGMKINTIIKRQV